MRQKVIKAGNSTAVTVPADFVKNIGINVGDSVDVKTFPERGQVTYTFSGVRQLAINSKLLKKRKTSAKDA